MSLSRKKDKAEKDKTKGSRPRLFGRKASKPPRQDPPTAKRTVQYPTISQYNTTSFGGVEGVTSQPLRPVDATAPRSFNRTNRASILLTADEFDALIGNTPSTGAYAMGYSPSNKLATSPPVLQTRKRDMSVVASDMSSTTRRDSQKTLFWNSVRAEPEPPTKKELKKQKVLERKAQKVRKSNYKKPNKMREEKMRPITDTLDASTPQVFGIEMTANGPDSTTNLTTSRGTERATPILTPAIALMIATVPRSVRPVRPAPPIVPPPTKMVFSPRAMDFTPVVTTGWGSLKSTSPDLDQAKPGGFGWTRPRDKLIPNQEKDVITQKPAPVTGAFQLGQRSRFSVSNGRGHSTREDQERMPQATPSTPLPATTQQNTRAQPDFQQQWQQWQNRQQRKVLQEKPQEKPAQGLAVSKTETEFVAEDPYSDPSTSSGEEDLTYRNSVSSLASLVSQLDVTYTLSQLKVEEEEDESYSSEYTSSGSGSTENHHTRPRRRTTVGTWKKPLTRADTQTESVAELDSCLNSLANLARDVSFDTIGPSTFPAKLQSSSGSEETSSSVEDLSSLSSAVCGINIDFNFSTSLRNNDDSSTYTSSDYSNSDSGSESHDNANGLSLSALKGLAGDLSFDISTSDESGDTSEDSGDSYEFEEERVQVVPRPGVEVVLGEKLGKGATATVWSGTYDGKPVAVKQITLRAFKEGEMHAQAAVKREYDTVRSIDHPSVVRYYGIFYNKTDQEVNIVMEMIRGVSLTDLIIYQDGLSEPHSAFLLKHILTAFSYLHDHCYLIHRDVKPDNILLDTRAKIKIIDFGTATSVDPLNSIKRRSTVGTPWYCAPEIVNDEEYAFRVDVWSIGCMAIELVTGEPPFCNLNDIECLFKMSEKKPPPIPEDVTDKCKDFLTQCLDPEWKTRPTATELLHHPFVSMTYAQERRLWSDLKCIVNKMSAAKDRASKTLPEGAV